MRRKSRAVAPSLPYEDWLIESLKDRKQAAAYLEAAIEDGDQTVLMLALRQVARARKFTFEKLLAEHRLLKFPHDREWLEFSSLPSEEP
ncbi:MAG: hypothetical protein HY848_04265 [Betaproteobacteria bacterium]|nr:hypothetical protein [Betaproteobacteria bacterium]